MSPEAFRAWQAQAGLSGNEAARVLGKSVPTIVRYRRAGVPDAEARTVGLAMAAILCGLEPWSPSTSPL